MSFFKSISHINKSLSLLYCLYMCVCTYMHVFLRARACVFYSYLAVSYLSLKISEDHCDFPPDYTPQLFSTFEDKRVCHVSHSEGFFSPLWKGHLTINTIMWQLNANHWIRCLLMNPVTLILHKSMLHRRIRFSVVARPCVGYLCLSSNFSAGAGLLLIFSGCSLCSTVTIPRRPHGWTLAWRRRRSPPRSVRMEVCGLYYSAGLLKRAVIPLTTITLVFT